jgi:hypothetical protein
MADNVTLNAMTGGNTVAADEVADGTLGTVKVQYVKLMDGTLDGTTKGVIDATYGLKVDVSRSASVVLGAGTNVIGYVYERSGATIGQGSAAPTTSATQIVASATTRRCVTITNTGTVQVNIGSASVTSSTGIPLAVGASVSITEAANAALYGITGSGTGAVTYMTELD